MADMRVNRLILALVVVAALLAPGQANASWTVVGDGIEYREYVLPDPNRLFVTRMSRANPNVTLETCIPQGQLSGGLREVVSSMASRNDGALSWWGGEWGATNDVVVAVNGDFWNTSNGVPWGGLFHSGWYAKNVNTSWGGAQFAWTTSRVPFISGCVETAAHVLKVGVEGGLTLVVDALNTQRVPDSLVLYTPQWAATTGTDSTGVEVLVELKQPLLALAPGSTHKGTVREIRQGQGSTLIPFDHVVLSGHGTAATALLHLANLSATLTFTVQVTTANGACQQPLAAKWNKAFASIHGNAVMLNNGTMPYDWHTERHPRTAVAYDSNYVYFVVCDGRSTISRGMTGTELANFCKNTLGARFGVNLDGGGSSTMVVNGAVKNVPSDGRERAVANGIMMVNVRPKSFTPAFCPGQLVATASANCRLGPGTNFGVITTLPSGTTGFVEDHPLNGVSAKGFNWWKVTTGSVTGWVAETLLSPAGVQPPFVAQHPVGRVVCEGDSAVLTVEARGSGCLSYRWQKDGADISEGERFSGVGTAALSVTGALPEDTGSYRCLVSNPYGSELSDPASLSIRRTPSVTIAAPTASATRTGPVNFTVRYLGVDSISLTPEAVQLNTTGTATGTVSVTGSGNLFRTVTVSNITGDGAISISLPPGTAQGCVPAPAVGPSQPFLADNTPPSGVTVLDEGAYTPSLTTLKARWTPAPDGTGSGISHYEYSVGTAPAATNVVGWKAAGNATEATVYGLSLEEGSSYYFGVRAVDAAGNVGPAGHSDGILVAPTVESIGAALSLPDGIPFSLRGKTVTAASGDAFWIQEPGQMSAMEVRSPVGVTPGSAVNLAGVMVLAQCQRVMGAHVVEPAGWGSQVSPVGMRARDLGGSAANALTPGAPGAPGPYNSGLLVRCWGRVLTTAPGDPDGFFRIDDGSVHGGVLVQADGAHPAPGSYAFVTGVVTILEVNTRCVPALIVHDPFAVVIWPD